MRVLELESVTKAYGQTTALRAIDLAIDAGYLVGLVGPNGAGKTTLIKSILNLVGIDGGVIRAFGLDHRRDERAVRERVGFVHESSYLFEDLTATQHERIARAAYREWDRGAFTRYLDRFALPAKKAVKSFSKGMKMRLSLAIALSHNAELILMDEPSSGLDPVVRHDLMTVIAEEIERRECTFLVSTHITSDLDRIADYVVVMLDGRIALHMSREQIDDRYAVCRGGLELLSNGTRELFLGVNRSEYAFTALTADRARVVSALGDAVVTERPTIEDLVVHLNREHTHESTLR